MRWSRPRSIAALSSTPRTSAHAREGNGPRRRGEPADRRVGHGEQLTESFLDGRPPRRAQIGVGDPDDAEVAPAARPRGASPPTAPVPVFGRATGPCTSRDRRAPRRPRRPRAVPPGRRRPACVRAWSGGRGRAGRTAVADLQRIERGPRDVESASVTTARGIGQADDVPGCPPLRKAPQSRRRPVAGRRRRTAHREAVELESATLLLGAGEVVGHDVDATAEPLPAAGCAQLPDLGVRVPRSPGVDGGEEPELVLRGGAKERMHRRSLGVRRTGGGLDDNLWTTGRPLGECPRVVQKSAPWRGTVHDTAVPSPGGGAPAGRKLGSDPRNTDGIPCR